jgi:LmbE family N-acetylglucosaminyl deacetylase
MPHSFESVREVPRLAPEDLPPPVLVLAPHPDDETLGCGGLVASIASTHATWLAWCSDGSRSPLPPLPGGAVHVDLAAVRAQEARRAAETLGIAPHRLRFLGLPDGGLRRNADRLRRALRSLADEIRPGTVLAPFRFDRHPDHEETSRAAAATFGTQAGTMLLEYFVYPRARLVPGGDVRRHVRAGSLVEFRPDPAARERKKEALRRFETQTTRFFSWQARPNLTDSLIEAVCGEAELFARFEPRTAGTRILEPGREWIAAAQRIEFRLKNGKERVLAILRGGST